MSFISLANKKLTTTTKTKFLPLYTDVLLRAKEWIIATNQVSLSTTPRPKQNRVEQTFFKNNSLKKDSIKVHKNTSFNQYPLQCRDSQVRIFLEYWETFSIHNGLDGNFSCNVYYYIQVLLNTLSTPDSVRAMNMLLISLGRGTPCLWVAMAAGLSDEQAHHIVMFLVLCVLIVRVVSGCLFSFMSVAISSLSVCLSLKVLSPSLQRDRYQYGESNSLQAKNIFRLARRLDWVASSSSRGSSQSRDPTQVFSIAGRVFTVWATREGPPHTKKKKKKVIITKFAQLCPK